MLMLDDVDLNCLHFDAIIDVAEASVVAAAAATVAVAVETAAEIGNYHCLVQMCIVVIVAQSVAVQIENRSVHLVEWQMALVRFGRSFLVGVQVVAAKFNQLINKNLLP